MPALYVLAAAVLFSTGGAAIKTAALTGVQVAGIRSGIAATLLLLWLRGRIQWSWRMLAVAAAYAATLVLFVTATKLTTAANAIFLQSAAPLYIVALAPWLLGERFRRSDLPLLAAGGLGLVLCFAGTAEPTTSAPNPVLGDLLAGACGITWALTLLGLRWVERRTAGGAISCVATGNLLAAFAALPALWSLPAISTGDWLLLGYLGTFQVAGAYMLLVQGVARLTALEVSLFLLIEPVLNPVWTWMIRGERPGSWAVAGGAVILIATAAQALAASRSPSHSAGR